jgi:hypothetical protein
MPMLRSGKVWQVIRHFGGGKVSAMKGTETERRDDAMAKRNHKQESQALKATKQYGHAAQAAGAGIGDVVSLKVDYRTHSLRCV